MSREIKFRSWDDDAELMFYSDNPPDDYFFEFKDGKLKGFAIRPPRPSSDSMEPPEPYCDDFPVMQYTGFKDKNGVESYQGDKISAFGYSNWVIDWHDNGWKLKQDWVSHWTEIPKDFVIIGNIHDKEKTNGS